MPETSSRNSLNKQAYDKVAKEYGKRVSVLSANNKKVISLFIDYLDKQFDGDLHHDLAILDIGVGSGLDLKFFNEQGFQVFGNEISEKMVDVAKNNVPEAQFFIGDFLKYNFPQKFDGIYAQAFIHLFPKAEVGEVFSKMFSLLNSKGLIHFSTTIHAEPWEGWEEKHDYEVKVKRFRKHWNLQELNDFLESIGVNVIHQYTIHDPLGKNWVNTIISN